ncbi:MAG: LPS export ABC transporter periplasmic protein LptC [Elusimicrobia bacterium CG08_land_8_20_14_0_20_51_18]|nr:MAG: LPS export ABC transporter periplasmic protein LptC [Elusimicrobia bacterium CG08_land_8_20_14_0_20_51_18]
MKQSLPVFFFSCALCLCSCRKEKSADNNMENMTFVKNFKLSEIKGTEKKWDIFCQSSLMNEAEGILKCTGPVISLYKDEKLSARITGENGILNMHEKKSFIKTDVEVRSLTEDVKLYSNDLFFDSGKSKIWSYNGVRVLRNNIETRANGFTAKPDLSKINFIRHETKKL